MLPFLILWKGLHVGESEMPESLKDLSTQFLAGRHNLMAFIHWLVRDADIAEDILQDVWIKLAEVWEREGGREIKDVLRWSRYTAKNLVLHYWRAKRTSKEIADEEILERAAQAFDEYSASNEWWREKRKALAACVQTLPPQSKKILSLKYQRGLSVASIAQHLERTPQAIKVALSRLRRAVGLCVEKKLAEAKL